MADNKQYKVLLVDDDKFLLDLYAAKFSKNGYVVSTASEGEEALKKMRDGIEIDALLMDVVMPGLDGIEVLEMIRKENLIPDAVVIMLTNQGQPSDIERAKALNVSGYIIKATTIPSEVVSEVDNVLHKKNSK